MLDTVLDIVGIKMNKTMFYALKGSKSNRGTQIDEKNDATEHCQCSDRSCGVSSALNLNNFLKNSPPIKQSNISYIPCYMSRQNLGDDPNI